MMLIYGDKDFIQVIVIMKKRREKIGNYIGVKKVGWMSWKRL